jgi:hypothetical protein
MADSRDIEKLKRRWEENPKGTSFAPLAELYRKDGQHDRALEVLRIGLESNPNHIPGNIVLGRCCLDLKQDPEAEAAFSKALELDPENVIALKALAEICERSGRLEASQQWLTQLVQVDPSNDDARDQLGRVQRAREVVTQATAETLLIAPLPPEEAPGPPAPEAPTPAGTLLEMHRLVIEASSTVVRAAEPEPAQVEPPAPMFFEEPVAAEPAPPLADLVSTEFDPSVASQVTPNAIPGMMVEDPAAAATPPIQDFQAVGGDFSGAGIDQLDVGVEKAEEIVLRVNTTSEFQTPSASDDLAAGFRIQSPEPAPVARPAESHPVEPPPPVIEEPVTSHAEEAPQPELVEAAAAESVHPAAPEGDEAIDFVQPDLPPNEPAAAPEAEPVVAAEPLPVEEALPVLELEPLPEPVPAPPPVPAAPLPIIYPPAETRAAEVDEIVPGGEPEPILTETMAELYLRQGHRHEALRVYRQLADRTPGDVHLRERVAELTASVAEGSAARRAAVAFAAAATGGQSVETLFRELLGAPLPEGEAAGVSEASAAGQAESGGGSPTRPAQDSLSLSAIFGEDASPVRPPVTSAAPAPENPGSEAGKAGVSFDQFFGDKPSTRGPSGVRPHRNSQGGTEEDLDQFQSWLKGLKR